MVTDWFEKEADNKQVIILDGYPRTVAQAEDFNNFIKLASNNLKLRVVRFVFLMIQLLIV